MPTSADDHPEVLLDASAALTFVLEDHEGHAATLAALRSRRRGLAGHAAFETYSVLTRLPAPARQSPASAARIVAANFAHSRFVGRAETAALLAELGRRGIAGGAVYDALVGATAKQEGVPLATRDRRALATYHALEVDVELLD